MASETVSDFTNNNYSLAKEKYKTWGIDTDEVIKTLSNYKISLPCWQTDDVTGLERASSLEGSGLQSTGSYPGKARNWEEIKSDLDKVLSLIPGTHRINVHAIYRSNGGSRIDRDQISVSHFSEWIEWAEEKKIGIDFNGSFFAHPNASDGNTLTHHDEKIRKFWINHGLRCREIGEAIGKRLGSRCITNIWIPDGSKDTCVDRYTPRKRLIESLDQILSTVHDGTFLADAVESKLFGIGSESFVAGSHEFYLLYASRAAKTPQLSGVPLRPEMLLCLDTGHFHPTEQISDKISSLLAFLPGVLLHISRGVRWDSDHVPVLNDELSSIARDIRTACAFEKINIALDFFDASINRIAALVVGARSFQKAMCMALLEPIEAIRETKKNVSNTSRLVLQEEFKNLPWNAVWEKFCLNYNVPTGRSLMESITQYEVDVLNKRRS